MNKKIKLSDFEIVPIMKSVHKEEISDAQYFGKSYSRYISNSRLKWINPDTEGSPELYQNPPKLTTSSLSIGSNVHEVLLQPEEFELAPLLGKPTAKLGAVIEEVYRLRRKGGIKLYDAIYNACNKVSYYINSIDRKIPFIIEKGIKYYLSRLEYDKITYVKEQIHLSESDYKTVSGCLESCRSNRQLMNLLKPTDMFGDPIDSFNEDALFMDFLVTYKGRCITLLFKLKADNWTIDFDNKVVTLNDLKTSGHFVDGFMEPGHSFENYHYSRQMGVYSSILWHYCERTFGVNKNTGWKLKANMLVVQTIPPYTSRCFVVNKTQLKQGLNEFNRLMKMVAYYEIFGYDKEVKFI